MRDSLLMLILVALMVGGGTLLRKAPPEASLSPVHSETQRMSKNLGGKNNAKTAKRLHRSHVDEGATVRETNPESIESLSASSENSEIEKLSSVLPKTLVKEQEGRVGLVNPPAKKKNRVAGVSIQDYVSLKRNSLPLPDVAREDGQGLRVFLNCMELKNKGLEYTGKSECDSLLGGLAKR